MDKKIAVLAPGGIGAPVGGLLTKAGHDVILIDQWPAHVEAMKAHGLRITLGTQQEPEGEIVVPVRAYHLYEVCTLHQPFDIVFLTAKSYDTRWLVQFIEPYLKPDGVLVSMQNSINDEWIVPIIGRDRDIACVITGGGELLGPGHVWRNRSLEHLYYTLGELDGKITPRLQDIVKILNEAGKTMISTNILGAKWSKLASNSMGVMGSLCNRRYWSLLDVPNFLPICVRLGKEAMQVGAALGYNMEPIFGMTAEDWLGSPEEVMKGLILASSRGASEGSINMVAQDVKRGRPTEVGGYLNGLLVRKGREAKVTTPMNEAFVEVFLRLEHGELQPGISNLDLVKLP